MYNSERNLSRSRIVVVAAVTAVFIVYIFLKMFYITADGDYYTSMKLSAPRSVVVVRSYGDICDRNHVPLINRAQTYIAAINPETCSREEIEPHIVDTEKYKECIDGTALFLCEVDTASLKNTLVIPVKKRYSEESTAVHIIGYTDGNGGVCGIEKTFDAQLRQPKSTVTLIYSTDANGNMLEGDGIRTVYSSIASEDVVLSIDYKIQQAAERAMMNVERGAAVVVDITTGDIAAVVSKPSYSQSSPADSLDSEDSPFVNRAFSAYSVGSVFKLVIAGAALEYGISDEFSYKCTGSVTVRQNEFDCHRFGGHGELDMRSAMVESCNPYFITLGQNIPTDLLHDFAVRLGFGSASELCEGISSASGYLPTEKELKVPEEKANFSFGQGMLTATPLQVTLMTAAIANGGMMPEPRLILSGEESIYKRVMSEETAEKLKSFMISTLYKDNSAALPLNTTGGGKTSTAQTWNYDEYGSEILNCWFSGFFPAYDPQYAVTVVIEDGVSGNLTCGPVFREIANAVSVDNF